MKNTHTQIRGGHGCHNVRDGSAPKMLLLRGVHTRRHWDMTVNTGDNRSHEAASG